MRSVACDKIELQYQLSLFGEQNLDREIGALYDSLLSILVKRVLGEDINADLRQSSQIYMIPSCVNMDSSNFVLPIECNSGMYTFEFYMPEEFPLIFCKKYSRYDPAVGCDGYSKLYMLTGLESSALRR